MPQNDEPAGAVCHVLQRASSQGLLISNKRCLLTLMGFFLSPQTHPHPDAYSQFSIAPRLIRLSHLCRICGVADLKSKCHLVSWLGLTQPVASLSPWQPGWACMPATQLYCSLSFLFLHTRLFKMQDVRTCQAVPVYCRFPLSVCRFI